MHSDTLFSIRMGHPRGIDRKIPGQEYVTYVPSGDLSDMRQMHRNH